jgi:hypothetical protein
MNVKQLRNLLLDYPDDLEILIASDEEGNDLNPLVELGLVYEEDGEILLASRLVLWP